MEHILVGIDGKHGAWEALSRACALAKRIDARLYVLLVLTPEHRVASYEDAEYEATVRKRLDLLIETAKSEGIAIDYFIAEGSFEEEVIRFVNHYRITLLVYELPQEDFRSAGKGSLSLHTIRHRISCKVELVAPKTKQ